MHTCWRPCLGVCLSACMPGCSYVVMHACMYACMHITGVCEQVCLCCATLHSPAAAAALSCSRRQRRFSPAAPEATRPTSGASASRASNSQKVGWHQSDRHVVAIVLAAREQRLIRLFPPPYRFFPFHAHTGNPPLSDVRPMTARSRISHDFTPSTAGCPPPPVPLPMP